MLPYTVFLRSGANDIVPVLVQAKNENEAFGQATRVYQSMFPGYTGVLSGIKIIIGWAVATNMSEAVH